MDDYRRTPRFPTTDWRLLRNAASDEESVAKRWSMDELLRHYMPPMWRYLVQTRGIDAHRADDLLQGFIADRIVESKLLGKADRGRGKFRSLLVKALHHYVIDEHRRTDARPADDRRRLLPLTDDMFVSDGGENDPARAFDRVWAEHVMSEALRRTRVRLEGSNRGPVWQVFERRMVDTNEAARDYRHLAEEFAFETPTQAATALNTAKRIFARKLRDVLLEYGGDAPDVEGELRDLMKIFQRSVAEK